MVLIWVYFRICEYNNSNDHYCWQCEWLSELEQIWIEYIRLWTRWYKPISELIGIMIQMVIVAGNVGGYWSWNGSGLSMFDSKPGWCYQNDKGYYKTVMAQLCVKSSCCYSFCSSKSSAFYIHNWHRQGTKPFLFWCPRLWRAALHTKGSPNRIAITISLN